MKNDDNLGLLKHKDPCDPEAHNACSKNNLNNGSDRATKPCQILDRQSRSATNLGNLGILAVGKQTNRHH